MLDIVNGRCLNGGMNVHQPVTRVSAAAGGGLSCSAAWRDKRAAGISVVVPTACNFFILTMSSIRLDDGEYTIRTFDGRVLAFPIIVKPDLGDVIIPPPPKPVYALPKTFQPEPISALVNDGGRLVEWIVTPQRWVLTFVRGQDAYLVQSEDLGTAWTAPPEGKFGQVHVNPVPWNGQTDPAYPTEFLFRFARV
ncbi:hypothetical protein EV401DRAFT_289535 [Pisolithus croceorrhizus]|nr:hypothetical protein EV401DRAFT_289535 [Pisolithus croceorrhizus]